MTISAVDCHYSITGSGPPLFLTHGIGAAEDAWRFMLPELSKHFTVVTYDLRGHGKSLVTHKNFTLDELVLDLERIREKNPHLADQIATNYRKADITPRQKAMLDFAVKVSIESSDLDESDFEEMRQHGFSDDDIWDTGAISAFFSLSNRMADLTNMRPNDDFYLLGRISKK